MKYFNRLKQFDRVTEFRLKNAFFVAVGISIMTPILISLKGQYMLPWIISAFAIAQALSVKTNGWFVSTFTLSQFLKIIIGFHIIFVITALTFFYSPTLMIWLSSIVAIIESTVFSAYSIVLNNYITDNYPKSMSTFQITRNGIWSDGFLLGLTTVTLITFFSEISSAIIIFMVFNSLYSLWLLYNINFYFNVK